MWIEIILIVVQSDSFYSTPSRVLCVCVHVYAHVCIKLCMYYNVCMYYLCMLVIIFVLIPTVE